VVVARLLPTFRPYGTGFVGRFVFVLLTILLTSAKWSPFILKRADSGTVKKDNPLI
jgi:hypothetical protein